MNTRQDLSITNLKINFNKNSNLNFSIFSYIKN